MRTKLGMLLLLVSPLAVYGQYCGTYTSYAKPVSYSSYYPTYAEKVVVKEVPVAVPILVPATVFQYIPAIVPTATAVTPVTPVSAVPTTPVAPTVPTTPSAAEMEKLITARVDKLVQERLKYIMPGDTGPPPLIMNAPANAPTPNNVPAPTNNNTGDINMQVAQILGNNCAKCHTQGTKTAGGVTLFVKNGEQLFLQPSVSKADIWNTVKPPTPSMPPAGNNQLKPEEVSLLQKWMSMQ